MEQTLNWWQYLPEQINPTVFKIGSFMLTYYALSYILGFGIVYLLVLYRLKSERWEYSKGIVQDCFLYCSLGAIIGGRLGYVVLHDFRYFLSNPLRIICPFDFANGIHYIGISGMAYYGALIGIVLVSIAFCRINKINYLHFTDLFLPAIPLGYTLGRLGNFINGEFYGRITTMPWGMYFLSDSTHQLRHPSQLYEAFFEGLFLFIILWSLRKKKYFDGFISGLYLIGYGLLRFFVEFSRQPDHKSGLIFGFLTIGQIFCILMVSAGIIGMLIKKSLDLQRSKKQVEIS
ncbi:MAG: prolipoprotein diacylglyceryl transferase [Candidatus Omnitrophota bacterium]